MALQALSRKDPTSPEHALRTLRRGEFESSQERDWLIDVVSGAPDIEARDLIWMLFKPDRVLRSAGTSMLQARPSVNLVELFVEHCRKSGGAAIRGATSCLFAANPEGIEETLDRLLSTGDEADVEVVKKIVAEAPPSPVLELLYWKLAADGNPQQQLLFIDRLSVAGFNPDNLDRWHALAGDEDASVREAALTVIAKNADDDSLELLIESLPEVAYGVQQHLVAGIASIVEDRGPEFANRILPLMASGDAGTRTAVLKVLLGMKNRRELVKRYLTFSRTLAGWIRERALESMKEFGEDLVEPTIELLEDPDESVRGSAVLVACSFVDPRVVPATIPLLHDPDWWVRITAAESLGRIGDPRAVEPLSQVLDDDETRWAAVEALGRIGDPRALSALVKLLNDPASEVRIEVLLALRNFQHPKILEVLSRVAAHDPDRVVRARALEIAEEIARRDSTELDNHSALKAQAHRLGKTDGEARIHSLLLAVRSRGASDLHVSVGCKPTMRLGADLIELGGPILTAGQTETLLREILTEDQQRVLKTDCQVDFCYYIPRAGRYRCNVFVDHKGVNGVFRVIAEKPPTIIDVGLPEHIAEIGSNHQGLVLVCGPSGSGKTTTLAALVNLFNETRHLHVITLEDPVEFVHPFKNCLINQREVGSHTRSFARALRASLREDPDVIMIGDLRDAETMSLALTAAETGHLVFGTLDSVDTVKAVGRVISSFPANQQSQVRTALADSLRLVIAQRLLPGIDPGSRVACFEILKGTLSVSHLIREDKLFQIHSAMQTGRSRGMQRFDDALKELVRHKRLDPETAYLAADSKEAFEPLVSEEFLETRTFL